MIRISFHCCQNIISAWKWVFFSKKNFGEKKNVSGEGKKEENYAGEFEPKGCKARVSGRRRRRRNISRHHAVLRLLNVMAREQQRQQPEEVSSSSSSFLKIEKKGVQKRQYTCGKKKRGTRERQTNPKR